ncbi:hypothetical protein [Pseudaestuariivita atlantica]|uniref:Desulfoferrodoxin ferrous iron-binding domain-containing protein n=1 Tax=Pseudaestuariivita atlantica TaxID=1317121 RepID=A0A0L1JQC4_9RHOB|nr:hypothetical protein [Pseudaestuariivita atlantica]KNG93936.1 hypothetical protein ATO11_11890 [Pseudaestuariivita atlantica]
MRLILASTALVASTLAAAADIPVIEKVVAKKTGMGWRFDVTLSHPDTGWDHYADGWEVVDADGNALGYRELMHPHVTEQPFTRSLNSVVVPDGVREVFIRAKCSVHGWGEPGVAVKLDPGG